MACDSASDREAANSPGESVNALPLPGLFCSSLAFSFWTKRLPVSTLLAKQPF
jgi:hypothetical protein